MKIKGETGSWKLNPQDSFKLPSGRFHEIHTISKVPSAFMYTFYNKTRLTNPTPTHNQSEPRISLYDDFQIKIDNFLNAIGLVSNAFLRILYSVPMMRRVKISYDGNIEL